MGLAGLGGLLALAGGASAGAQQQRAEDTAAVKAACGALDVNFSVKDGGAAAPGAAAAPTAGKALVYVFEDVQNVAFVSATNFRVGLNGGWVGALKGGTYLSFPVDPGVQHLCVSVQGHALFQLQHGIVLRQLRPEAGSAYYLRLRMTLGNGTLPLVWLEPVDEDEGRLLLQTMGLAVWQKK